MVLTCATTLDRFLLNHGKNKTFHEVDVLTKEDRFVTVPEPWKIHTLAV